jgi:hypothetical protein
MNRATEDDLPPEVLIGATLRGNEFGWTVASFPHALQKAEKYRLACLGGQFQFRVEEGTCEMYWLESNSSKRGVTESWVDYCHRSCNEVREDFDRLVEMTDFIEKASDWPLLRKKIAEGFNVMSSLVFVAYFINESESTLRSSR